MSELWDAYDKDFNKIENVTLVRNEVIPEGYFHVVVSIIVKHVDDTFLLMQRDLKKVYGGKWELSGGGSVLKGETPLQGAIREIWEETGIVFRDLKQVDSFINEKNKAFYFYFVGVTDCKKDSIILQKGETIGYKWVTVDELKEMPESEFATLNEKKKISEFRV